MSFSDALTRISDIQSQMSALVTGGPAAPTSAAAAGSGGAGLASAGAGGVGESSPAGATSFASALAAASTSPTGVGGTAGPSGLLNAVAAEAGGMGATGAGAGTAAALGGAGSTGGVSASVLSLLASMGAGAGAAGTGGAGAAAAALPANAAAQLTPGQRTFASTLVAETGLDPGVVSAWLLAEESGGAAGSRQAAGNHDWLNIGYTDAGTVGAADSIWSDPVSAATATAQWLKGQDSIPGYGTASAGVQGILASVGQGPAAEISALQHSGWASSGYPDLTSLYAQVAG